MEQTQSNLPNIDRNTMARIHSFESFGTVDGPGIRFVLFMQGCHLRCKYCHNRDTWDCNSGTIYTVEEVLSKILRYKNYILPSGGGVTATGGEPLLQFPFLITLFKKLKQEGIPTAIDTSGMVDITDGIQELISLTDLFYLYRGQVSTGYPLYILSHALLRLINLAVIVKVHLHHLNHLYIVLMV